VKKILFSIIALLGVFSASAQQTWNFTTTPAADVSLLSSATTEWQYTEKSNRYENQKEVNGPVTAGGTELQMTQGLTVTGAGVGKLKIDVDKRIQLGGKNIAITTPRLRKGQTVTIVFASTGDTKATFDNLTNLTQAAGFVAADKNTTQTGTAVVAQDGAVAFASATGSLNVFSIAVSEAQEQGGNTEGDIIENAVPRNVNVNQAVITLNDGSAKYYNTQSLAAIDFDHSTGKIILNTTAQRQDVYNASAARLSFAKKIDNGQQTEIDNNGVVITEAAGWLESAYVKFDLFEGAKTYNVYVKGGQYADFTKIDNQLVRDYGTYGRADMVGLVEGSYDMKVVPVDGQGAELTAKASTASHLNVKPYDRTGYAHFNFNEGVGAYNNDGSLKQGAKVFYVTAKTAKTITTTVTTDSKGGKTQVKGLQRIISAYEKGFDTTPIAFRFIGMMTKNDLDSIGSKEEGLQIKGRKADSPLNMTLEGIGDDATINGFGVLVRNSRSVEFRNFGIIRCMDDGLSLDTDNSNIWIHHIDVFYGAHGSGDHDKGDGSVDAKADSKYVTVSYCHYWDTGKTNMFGMKSESGPNYISYHHNWFDHSDSRHPRVRTMTVHVWNNYFDNVAKYGVGATTGASIFVENNYFLKTKKPILNSLQGTDGLGSGTFSNESGGMIKAYGNYIDNNIRNFSYYTQANPSSKGYDAYEVASRDEQVPATEKALAGGTAYNNFDTNSQLIYDYTPDAAADVPTIVTGYYGAGRLNHGDFTYTFTDNIGDEDTDSQYDTVLAALLDSYKPALKGFFGEEATQTEEPGDDPGDEPGNDEPQQQEGTIVASFDGAPSNSMFTVGGSYGDGKITYNGVYYKKGVKLDSKGSITFTPAFDYNMTIVMGTAKPARNVNLNGVQTTVSGTENTEGLYYQLEPIAISKDTQYVITKGSAEGLVMLIILEPR
jgi:pectate lyase